MKFLDSILQQRNGLAIVTGDPESDELTTLQQEIDADRAQLAGMEHEAQQADAALAELAGAAVRLKVEISEGSPSAAVTLDGQESKQRAIERRREGLGQRISTARTLLAPKELRATELARLRDAARREQELCELRERCELLMTQTLDIWQSACAKAFALMELLDGAIQAGGTTSGSAEEQRAAREDFRVSVRALTSELAKRSFQAGLAPGNERWEHRRNDLFHTLQIKPAVRREIARTG